MLSVLPTLQSQRDVLDVPRGPARFREYLNVMIRGTGDVVLPLPAFNPMSKDHVRSVLDALIEVDAEKVAGNAVTEAQRRLGSIDADLGLALVVSDDVAGGWTNREMIEADRLRCLPRALHQRGWLVVLYWASEPASAEKVREEVLAGIYRELYLMQRDAPETLEQMMQLEGKSLEFAGAKCPSLDAEDLEYSRAVIAPFRSARAFEEFPTVFTCLFGDEAAGRVAYPPMGLSPRAGCAVALADAHRAE